MWYNTLVLRGFHITEVNLNTNFSLPDWMKNLKKENIGFFFTYKKLNVTGSIFDSTLTLKEVSSFTYRLSANSGVLDDSIVSVLIYEKDYMSN